jgi:hypothetical protein
MSQTEYDAGKRSYEAGNSSPSTGTNAFSGWLAGQADAQRAADQKATQERQQREAMQRDSSGGGFKWW